MAMMLERPTRICIVGSSSTGKTELVKKMILRCDFGNKKDLEVLLYAPSDITLNQKCWKTLEKKKINIKKSFLSKDTPRPKDKTTKERLVIFDDVDDAISLPKWVRERFTIASHHLNESVICISHRLKIGVMEIRNCADWIVLTASPEPMIIETCKSLGIDSDKIIDLLLDEKGIVKISENNYRSYNHVCIKHSFCVNHSPFYQISDSLFDKFTFYPSC